MFHRSQFQQIRQFLGLRRSQWNSLPDLQKIQTKNLKKIVNHAYENVKYYHELFKSLNLKPEDIQTRSDLSNLPILRKTEIQKSPESFYAKNIETNKCTLRRTSGSTGIPLTVIFDSNAQSNRRSRYLRSYTECGLKPWHTIHQISTPRNFGFNKFWFNRFGLFNRKNFSVFDPVDITIKKLAESHPDAIEGYPSYIVLLGEKLSQYNDVQLQPNLIFTSTELLTDSVRNRIESDFQTEVFDRYGSTEFHIFAWECRKHEGYHIDVEDVVVEFLRDGEPVASGEKGEVVVTGLSNFAMPLIRYSLGDTATSSDEKCSCGRGLPLMKIIDGRTDDFLVLPSGEHVSPRTVARVEYLKGIRRVRIIQEKIDEIIVKIEPEKSFKEETISEIRDIILRGCHGEQINVIVDLVMEIPRDNTGKFRVVISKVNQQES